MLSGPLPLSFGGRCGHGNWENCQNRVLTSRISNSGVAPLRSGGIHSGLGWMAESKLLANRVG
jgi:hypothetical protein